jgi:predicted neuraminidase
MPSPARSPIPTQPAPGLPRWLAALAFSAALGAAFWRMPDAGSPSFPPPPPATSNKLPALFVGQMLPAAGIVAQAPSLVLLADGRLGAAWTAGSADDASDLAIHFSVLERDGWRLPQAIATREGTAGSLFAHIRRIGQPVLFREGSWLHLWYIASGPAGNRLLVHSRSTDGGRQWSPPQRLSTSPLAGFGTALGGPPLALSDGGLGLPLSHELFAGFGEWLRLDARGRVVDKARLAQPERALQPAMINLDEQRAVALSRDAGPAPGQVRAVLTNNGGLQWSATTDPGPPSPNLPLALLRLADGRLLLAGNPAAGREKLMLWISGDDGQTWRESRVIEAATDTNASFTAPSLLLGRDGRIHLAYLRREEGIRHVVFTPAWLDEGNP